MSVAEFMVQVSNVFGVNKEHDIIVDNTLLVVGSGDLVRNFATANPNKYAITIMPSISDYSGSLGDFRVEVGESQGESADFANATFAQIVFFGAPREIKKPQLGIHFVSDYENQSALCDEIDALIGDFSFEKTILFDEKKCQYFHRDKTEFSYCTDCVAVCPTMAISANDAKRELVFSQIDCVLCGKCVAVCPSGAMQKSNATIINLNKALKLFKGKIAVVCESEKDFERFCENAESAFLEVDCHDSAFAESRNDKTEILRYAQNDKVGADFTPLILPSINMLNEAYLLSILQESGRICVILGDLGDSNKKIDSHLKECADFVNDLYNRVVGQNTVFMVDLSASENADFITHSAKETRLPYYHYDISEGEFIREILANRIRFLIKESDFGTLKNSANLIYTDLKIDAEKCTLCMSCVESCNANALISAKDNFTLLLNPSLCTACGYCIDTCAEKCIEMSLSGYRLNENFLTHRVLASDEPFRCVECGKIYATNKSIQKIKGILQPLFMGDSTKLKSIECCEKCKVKIMFEKSVDLVETQRGGL